MCFNVSSAAVVCNRSIFVDIGNTATADVKPQWVGVSVSQSCASPPIPSKNNGNSTGRRMSVGSNSSGSSNHSGYSSAAVSYGSGGGSGSVNTNTRRGGGRRKEDRNDVRIFFIVCVVFFVYC